MYSDWEDSQSVNQGQFFQSIGPELFIDFSKYQADNLANYCTILQPVERFGERRKITISGQFDEWLLYFAQYKKALTNLALYKMHNIIADEPITEKMLKKENLILKETEKGKTAPTYSYYKGLDDAIITGKYNNEYL